MGLTFEQPLWLGLLLPSLGIVYFLWRTSRVYLPTTRRYLALGLRMLAVTLLVGIFAQPSLKLNASDLAVAVLLDRSASISPAQRAAEESWLADALSHKSSNDQLGVISFAGQAQVERPLSADSTPPVLAQDSTLQTSSTDIGHAIQLALGVLPPDSARRIVLISDGNENSGQAYGPGLYARTPLEELLPVQTALRGSSLKTGVGLVLVVDTSGSMGQNVGGTTIMDLAKEAALAAADSLSPTDQIGVISFEDKSSWAIQPTPASQMDAISAAVNQMTPGGGDDTIGGVLNLAYGGLAGSSAQSKHVIVITDGETPGGDYAGIIQQMQSNGVTVSSIGIGSQADTQLLQQIAQMGGGAYYDGSDPFNLPQLLVKETQQLQRAAIVEQDTQPVVVHPSPMLDGFDPQQMPVLRGYVATTPRAQSTVVLASPNGDPLLTEWQNGLGRVIAWSSDATNRWSAPWLSGGQPYGAFWAQVVKRTIRPPEDPNRQVSVNVSGNRAAVTLNAETGAEGPAARQYVNFLPTSAAIVDPQGVPVQVQLPQVVPGQYQASLTVGTDGVYSLQVTEHEGDGSQTTQSSGFVVPYSPEYRDLATSDALLASLASATGGRVLQNPEEAFVHDLPAVGAARPIWPQLLMLLALVLVADVAVRRVRLSVFEVRTGFETFRGRFGDETPRRVGVARRVAAPARAAVPLISRESASAAARTEPPSAGGKSMSQQLLAAKRRAAKQ